MIQFQSPSKGGCRISGGARALSVYLPKPAANDLILLSTPEESHSKDTFSWPGEYDIAGVTLRGIGHGEGSQVSWLAVIDGVRIALPSRPLTEWTDHELEQIGDVHVLVVPAEDAKKVQKLIDDIDPRVLILVEGDKGFDPEVVKICGATGKEQVGDFKLKGSLPAEGREVVVLAK